MEITETSIEGLLKIQPDLFGDDRGFFLETWNSEKFSAKGLDYHFVQDNLSKSKRGVLRGLHYQSPGAQGKLVHCLEGEVFDVAVDLRKGSKTYGKWESFLLYGSKKNQFFVPEGFAHGFEVLSETAIFAYKCTAVYKPEFDHTLMYNDPDLNIPWNTKTPLISEKDKKGLYLKDLPEDVFPA